MLADIFLLGRKEKLKVSLSTENALTRHYHAILGEKQNTAHAHSHIMYAYGHFPFWGFLFLTQFCRLTFEFFHDVMVAAAVAVANSAIHVIVVVVVVIAGILLPLTWKNSNTFNFQLCVFWIWK